MTLLWSRPESPSRVQHGSQRVRRVNPLDQMAACAKIIHSRNGASGIVHFKLPVIFSITG